MKVQCFYLGKMVKLNESGTCDQTCNVEKCKHNTKK